MKILRNNNIFFILIVLAFCVYAGIFIFRTSFVIDGERYFTLLDDAMISMRYAKNLANGYGLVWNPGGERVEGYSNPLWTLYMSLFHLFPIPQSKISLFIQITNALLLVINLYYVKKIAYFISNGSRPAFLGAVLLTAFYFPLNNWSLRGMEVGLLTLIISISLWHALQCLNKKRVSYWLYILLGIGTFVRPDMVIPFFGIGVFLAIAEPENRAKNIIFGSTILLLCIFIQIVFRKWYYGEIFPNTYYLKMTGFPALLRITRGLYVFFNFVWNALFLIPFGILFFRRDRFILLLFWIFLIQIVYSIYVGGDMAEEWGGSNRFISIVMPIFFILFSYSLSYLCSIVIGNANLSEKVKKYSIRYIFPFLLIISLINFHWYQGPKNIKELLLIKRTYDVQQAELRVRLALLLRKITTPQAKIAVVAAGTIPYFSDRYAIDLLGKNDKRIARKKAREGYGPFRPVSWLQRLKSYTPGHNKYDLDYSIKQLKPDVVMLLGFLFILEEGMQYINNNYYKLIKLLGKYEFLVRIDSTNIIWKELKILSKEV
jgi:hypothetical protein